MKFGREYSYYPNTSKDQVFQLLESKEQLWGENSGALLQWCQKSVYEGQTVYEPVSNRPSLAMLFNHGFGFHFRFDDRSLQQVAICPSASFVRVPQQICGDVAYFPSNTFFEIAVAKSIVTAFIDADAPFSGVVWKDASRFNYHDNNEWENFGVVA